MEPHITMALYCGQIKRIQATTDVSVKSMARDLLPK